MDKNEFLWRLEKGLSGLTREEKNEHIAFYSEMIDDRIEEGLSEEDAIAGIGSPESIAFQIMQEHGGITKNTNQNRKLTAWEIVLLVLGSPIWISILIGILSVIFALYVVLWSAIASFWAVAVSFIGVALGSFATFGVFLFFGNTMQGFAMLGMGLFSVGLAIFGIIGSIGATKGCVLLTKKSVLWIISLFKRKEKEI